MRRTLFFRTLVSSLSLVSLAGLATLASCSREPSELSAGPEPTPPTHGSTAPRPAPTPRPTPPAMSAAPRVLALHWDDPPRWQRRLPSTAMRAMEYRVPRSGGDNEDGECFVITFGPGQGGTIDENIERWLKQMAPLSSTVDRSTRTVNGMTVTRVEVAGTYTPMGMPAMPVKTIVPRPGQRMVGDIVEAPSGLWFFKMTGPDATVSAAAKELDRLIDTIRPS